MKLHACTACGSKELYEDGDYQTCAYCRARLVPQEDDFPSKKTQISISSDIDALLKKCESDKANRRRYINLILDLDPTNKKVDKFM
jgi:hypothetical protein